ncbi:MAG: hypothetical protein BWX68_00758 [Verrucomicrobia bacterium ADurb.Bin063]|nr:MAG: hypothetical protein BWX68_00758 [Verrucomicrobia bacterium ADurb.Bin063]
MDPCKRIGIAVVAIVIAAVAGVAFEVEIITLAAVPRGYAKRYLAAEQAVHDQFSLVGRAIDERIGIQPAFAPRKIAIGGIAHTAGTVAPKHDPVVQIDPLVAIHVDFAAGGGGVAAAVAATGGPTFIAINIDSVPNVQVAGYAVQHAFPTAGIRTHVNIGIFATQSIATVVVTQALPQESIGPGVNPVHVNVPFAMPDKPGYELGPSVKGRATRVPTVSVPIGAAIRMGGPATT